MGSEEERPHASGCSTPTWTVRVSSAPPLVRDPDDATAFQTHYAKAGDNYLLTHVWFESGEGGRKLWYQFQSMDGDHAHGDHQVRQVRHDPVGCHRRTGECAQGVQRC